MDSLKIVFTALKVVASCPVLLLLPEATAEVEGFRRRSEDHALCRSGDGSLRWSSLLEYLLSPLDGRSFWERPKFSRPRTSSSFARMNQFARVIGSFMVGHGVHDQLRPKLDARAQGQLKGFHHHLLISALDLTVNSPKATGELGDVLVFSHPEGHQINIGLQDDAMGLELPRKDVRSCRQLEMEPPGSE